MLLPAAYTLQLIVNYSHLEVQNTTIKHNKTKKESTLTKHNSTAKQHDYQTEHTKQEMTVKRRDNRKGSKRFQITQHFTEHTEQNRR